MAKKNLIFILLEKFRYLIINLQHLLQLNNKQDK